jgi:mono/diheme cytochrome c family protein
MEICLRSFSEERMKVVGLILFLIMVITFGVVARTNSGLPLRELTPGNATSAATLYARNCVRCHGKDGRAKGIKHSLSGARNLTDPTWQDRVSDERIFNVITNGKGKMPGFSKKISEGEIESLVQFVRGLRKE